MKNIVSIGGDVIKMNKLVFIAVIFYPRCKFEFIRWGLDNFYEKKVVDSLCDKVRQTLKKMFESYRLFLSEGQAESVAQEIEPPKFITSSDHMDDEFEKDMDQDPNLNKN